MEENKYTNEEILELFSNLKPPFDEANTEASKQKIMAFITQEGKNNSWLRMAAAIAFLVGLGVVLLNFLRVQVNASGSDKLAHELPCGSKIELAEGSISYQPLFWSFDRKIEFHGQGFFDVEEGRPFSVESKIGRVLVKGTSFLVVSDANDLFVHCESGEVAVESSKSSFDLAPNGFCKIDAESSIEGSASASRSIQIMKSSKLDFENDPVELVLVKLEDWYGVEINSNLSNHRFYSGNLKGENLEEDLRVFSQTFNAKFNFDKAGNVLIK